MNLPTGFHFRDDPLGSQTPDGWRALDRTVARWVSVHGGSTLLARVAGWAAHADALGDSALPLRGDGAGRHGMEPIDDHALASLMGEPMVEVLPPTRTSTSIGGAPIPARTPFVIEDGHFYLRRNHRHEGAIATHVRQRREQEKTAAVALDTDIDVLFQGVADARVAAQRAAVAQVAGRRLFVLTGGPGTGKTTTVLRMLMLLLKRRADGGEASPVIHVSAPTGKAAQRLSESLREGAERMRAAAAPLPPAWQPHLDAALTAQSSTLHRLLGSRGQRGGFVHHAGHPVPADIVIVDEASMVDLAMLRNLLDALRADTTLILVGDADQLTSVGTGSVLLDIVGALEGEGDPGLVRLTHSFRADQSLVPVNEAVRRGDLNAFAVACDAAGGQIRRVPIDTEADLQVALRRWAAALVDGLARAGAFASLPRDVTGERVQHAVLAALDGLRERQLLCGLREGEFGADSSNRHLEALLRIASSSHEASSSDGEWYCGRAVMITRNDYTAGLFNGDIGLCLRDADGGLGVWFEVNVGDAEFTGSVGPTQISSQRTGRCALRFSTGGLPDHQGAFAITIHKSQGSEYRHVAVLLPPDRDSRILSRQLLYTAISRARHTVELWAAEPVLAHAISTSARRWSGLRRRLETCSTPSPGSEV
ncbi:MAG: exodeoxyribonuclease V subunit alpha [Lysobacter sp.]